jgi:hypothetical protein
MGSVTDAKIAAFQQRIGITPPFARLHSAFEPRRNERGAANLPILHAGYRHGDYAAASRIKMQIRIISVVP